MHVIAGDCLGLYECGGLLSCSKLVWTVLDPASTVLYIDSHEFTWHRPGLLAISLMSPKV